MLKTVTGSTTGWPAVREGKVTASSSSLPVVSSPLAVLLRVEAPSMSTVAPRRRLELAVEKASAKSKSSP